MFNYFAGQIFNDLPAAVRDVLVQTSFLPHITVEMAKEISGNFDAGKVLEEFYRRHLFTDRRTGEQLTYHYHALFRAFLLAKAEEAHASSGLAQMRQRAARLLEANGDSEAAVLLYQEANDWTGATKLILQQAPALLTHGRHETLRNWITVLPEDIKEDSPWLLYWLGVCDVAVNPARARTVLERTFEMMKDQEDVEGQLLAAATIVETHYLEWADFNALDRWIIELERLLTQDLVFPSSEVELRAVCGMLVATMSRQPQHPMLPACAERVMRLLDGDLEINETVIAGTFLLHYHLLSLDMETCARVVARIRPLLNQPELMPYRHVVWLSRYARYCAFNADFESASLSFRQALDLIEKEGLRFYEPVLQRHQLLVSLTLMDTTLAQALVTKLEPAIDPARRIDVAMLYLGKSWIALQQSNLAQALWHAQAGVEVAAEAGAVTIQSLCMMALAEVASEQQEIDRVRSYIEQIRVMFPVLGAAYFDHLALTFEAKFAFQQGRLNEASALLRSAIAIAKREQYVNMHWCPRLLAWMCRFALEHGVEVDYVRTKIRQCGVLPESPEVENWPWPIRIYTLGRFSIVKDGEPLTFAGKTQARPLDLLKAPIALGGRDVDFTVLMAIFWPDATGDAQKSLEMTLSRLRKLLGRSDVILMQDRKLTLNPRLVWVDAWAFERLLPRADDEITHDNEASGAGPDREQRAFDLYKGRFLEREPSAPWMQTMADRLQARFLRLVLAMGQAREATNWEQAALAYERGLDLDNLAEELYRRLMICHRERGRVAEAMNVYRRCRDNLSIILGVAPSADTVAIYNSLRQQ